MPQRKISKKKKKEAEETNKLIEKDVSKEGLK